ncbi:hypothetical protein [Streptomyces vinaceus]|uniref:hypothetical protein n=1 Tax=Streptomyces vinaceus TaxID=1960 RepID=UPI00381E76EE
MIENIGQTLARNVRISVTPPLQTTLGAEKAEILNRAVGRHIATLPPKRRTPFVMDVGHQLFSSELPKVYEFQADADGPFGRVGTLTYTVDLEALRDSALETDSVEWSVHQVAEHFGETVKALGRQARSLDELSQQVQRGVELQESERPSGADVPDSAEPALPEIPLAPLSDDGDPA